VNEEIFSKKVASKMSVTAEPTIAERLTGLDKLKAEARQFAAKIKHKNREYRRTRLVAALMVAEGIGFSYSEERLRKSGCRYITIGKTPLYRDADLHDLVKLILDRALTHDRAA
jgi:hypothetical protein